MTSQIKLKKSSVTGKIPTTGDLDYGELAINYTDGKIYYKTASNQIACFIDSDLTNTLIATRLAELGIGDSSSILATIDGRVTKSFIDALGIDAITLGGHDSSYYLNYNNFTNTPTNISTFTNDAGYITLAQALDSSEAQALIDASIAALVDTAPTTLDTLNELAAALGDDPNFATTITNLIAAKLDSAQTINLIDSAYVQARQDYAYGSLTGVPTNVSTFVNDTNYLDSTTVTDVIDSTYVQARQTPQDFAYSSLTGTPTNVSTFVNDANYLDSSTVQGVIDQTYIRAKQDYAYGSLTGVPTNVSTFVNDANYLDSTTVQGVIDASYVQSNQITYNTSNFLDSDTVSLVVDNAYVQSRQITYNTSDFLDSASVELVVDGSYVQARQITYNTSNFTDSAFVTGLPISTFTNDANYLDSTTVLDVIDATYVQSNQITYNTSNFTDSAFVTGLPVSTFVNDANYLDSTTVQNLIDASYIQANQITYNTSDFVDSAYVATQINNLIDGAPGALDTLNEIAAALNDDAAAFNTLVGLINSMADSAWVQSLPVSTFANDANYLDSSTVQGVINSAYVNGLVDSVGTATNSANLNNQNGAYYLNYNNLANTPVIPSLGNDYVDSAGVSAIITANVNATFINALTIDADTLGGQTSAYHLDYTNFTNTPTIPTALTDLGISDGSNLQVLTTNGAGVFTFTTVASGGGGGSAITVQDEGIPLATAAEILNFVGSGVVVTGTGTTKTITISDSGGGTGLIEYTESAPTTTTIVLDSFAISEYRSGEYIISCESPSLGYHTLKLIVIHNGTTVSYVQYGDVIIGAEVGTVSAQIVDTTVEILFTGNSTDAFVTFKRIMLTPQISGSGIPSDLMTGSSTIDLMSGTSTTDLQN